MVDELAVRVRLIDARLAQIESARTEKAIRGIGRGAKEAGREAREGSRHFGLMSRAVGGFRFAAGAAGFASLAFGVRDVISAGMRLQDQQAQLRGALAATGVRGSGAFEQINKAADKLTGRGGFAVPEQLQGMTQFVRITGSATKAVQLNAAATNLARGAHIDFARAQMMLQRVIATGTVGRFAPYVGMLQTTKTHVDALTAAHKLNVAGINAQAHAMGKAGAAWKAQQLIAAGVGSQALATAKMLDKQATAQAVVAAVQTKYGAATTAYSHTAAGAMSNLRNVLESVMGRVGLLILPLVTKIARALGSLVEKFQAHLPQIKRVAKAVFGPVIDLVKDVVHWFGKHRDVAIALVATMGTAVAVFGAFKAALAVQSLIQGVTAATAALGITMGALPFVAVVAGIAALVGGFTYLYVHVKSFRDAVQSVFQWLKAAVTDVVAVVVPIFKHMVDSWVSVFVGAATIFKGIWDVIRGIFTLNARLVWAGVTGIFRGAIQEIGGILGTMLTPFRLVFAGIKAVVAPVIKWLVDKIKWVVDKVLWLPRQIAKLNPFSAAPNYTPQQLTRPGGPSGALRRASGGPVPGYGAGDSVPALLTPGEFVVQRQSLAGFHARDAALQPDGADARSLISGGCGDPSHDKA